jgi:hypothetical protein
LSGKLWRRKIPFAFTPIPHALYGWLGVLSKNELAVYLAIMRFCWAPTKSGSDTIAISQIVQLTGIARRSVDRTLHSLKARGLLKVTGSIKKPRVYEPTLTAFTQESNAIAVASQGQILRQQDGASLTPIEWRTPKKRESELRIVP